MVTKRKSMKNDLVLSIPKVEYKNPSGSKPNQNYMSVNVSKQVITPPKKQLNRRKTQLVQDKSLGESRIDSYYLNNMRSKVSDDNSSCKNAKKIKDLKLRGQESQGNDKYASAGGAYSLRKSVSRCLKKGPGDIKTS